MFTGLEDDTMKTAEIKIRVTEHEKNELKQSASSHNESLSAYMLRKSLPGSEDSMKMIPEQIDKCSFFNEIYHIISRNGSESLKDEIMELYKKYYQAIEERMNGYEKFETGQSV